jgi:hypothetical protein
MRGWRRLGIVFSVFWFIAFGLWMRQHEIDSMRETFRDHCHTVYEMRRRYIDPSYETKDMIDSQERECYYQAEKSALSLAPQMAAALLWGSLSLPLVWLGVGRRCHRTVGRGGLSAAGVM